MNEAIAVGLVALAIGLSYGADRRRGVARAAWLDSPPRARAARLAALALVGVATLLWNAAEPGPAAFLAIPVALMAAGTFGTLLGGGLAAPAGGAERGAAPGGGARGQRRRA